MKNIIVATLAVWLVALLIVCAFAASSPGTAAETAEETKASTTSVLAADTVSERVEPSAQPTVSSTIDKMQPVETEPEWQPDEADIIAIAKTLYRECRGVPDTAEQAAVVWCILNRVDSQIAYFPDTIIEVVTQPNQFAYDEDTPVTGELYELAKDVLIRWNAEREGDTNVGRTLPEDYVYFIGDGTHNYFSIEWRSTEYWDWSCESPYGK